MDKAQAVATAHNIICGHASAVRALAKLDSLIEGLRNAGAGADDMARLNAARAKASSGVKRLEALIDKAAKQYSEKS